MYYEFAEEPYLHGLGAWVMACGKCNAKLENNYRWVWDGYNATVCTTICGACCTAEEASEELKQYCNPTFIPLKTDKIQVEMPMYKVIRSSGTIEDKWFVSSQRRESARYIDPRVSFENEPTMLRVTDSRCGLRVLMSDGKGTRKYVDWVEFLSINGIEYFNPISEQAADIPEHVMKIVHSL